MGNNILIPNLNRLVLAKNPLFPPQFNFVFPDYQGYSIANLPASLCKWLGVSKLGQKELVLPDGFIEKKSYKQVILFLVDALGLDALIAERKSAGWKELIGETNLIALSSVVPSTTTSALVSLWTGCAPIEHGLTGYEMYLKEYGLIANMITFAPSAFAGEINILRKAGFQPENFLGIPTLSNHLRYHNVEVHAFQPAPIARSSLTTMLMPGASVHPYRTQSDLWISLAQLVSQRPADPRYIWAYWGDYDDLGHQYGIDDARLKRELEHLALHIKQFVADIPVSDREDTLFLLCADHGMVSTIQDPWFEVRNHSQVWNKLVMPPSGENRLAYLYPYAHSATQLSSEIQETWGDSFLQINSQDAIKSGIFGQGIAHPAFADRVGETMLIATQDAYLWWAYKENTLKGRHGALHRSEMLVPLLSIHL